MNLVGRILIYSSIYTYKIIVDQTKRIEERLRKVEQKQDELSDTQKEIIHLVNKVKKDSFSMKYVRLFRTFDPYIITSI